jgi:hypothetical protein
VMLVDSLRGRRRPTLWLGAVVGGITAARGLGGMFYADGSRALVASAVWVALFGLMAVASVAALVRPAGPTDRRATTGSDGVAWPAGQPVLFAWRHRIVATRLREVPWGRLVVLGVAMMGLVVPFLLFSDSVAKALLVFVAGAALWTVTFSISSWWAIRTTGQQVYPPAPWIERWDRLWGRSSGV